MGKESGFEVAEVFVRQGQTQLACQIQPHHGVSLGVQMQFVPQKQTVKAARRSASSQWRIFREAFRVRR